MGLGLRVPLCYKSTLEMNYEIELDRIQHWLKFISLSSDRFSPNSTLFMMSQAQCLMEAQDHWWAARYDQDALAAGN